MSCEIRRLGNTEVILRFPLPMSGCRTFLFSWLQASALHLLYSLMLAGCSVLSFFFFFYSGVHVGRRRNVELQSVTAVTYNAERAQAKAAALEVD